MMPTGTLSPDHELTIETILEEELACDKCAENQATWSVRKRCCGFVFLVCDACKRRVQDAINTIVSLVPTSKMTCKSCGTARLVDGMFTFEKL